MHQKIRQTFLAASTLLLGLAGCGTDTNTENNQVEATPQQESTENTEPNISTTLNGEKPMTLTGKVVFKPIEGGFYAIDGDDGQHYLPLNLPEEARKGGIKVTFTAQIKKNVVTIYNYGIPIEIISLDITDANGEPENTH